jgi:transposase InsO family protein
MEQVEHKRESKKKSNKGKRFGCSFRLRVVKLHEEDGYPVDVICKESGISRTSLGRWLNIYRKVGVSGLEDRRPSGKRRQIPEAVADKIVSIKKSHPEYGVRRISNFLRRLFFLPGSAESVRRVLINKGINTPQKKRRVKNMTRPRFFERSTPNQMWQTDIFTFRLGGRYAYLIGFIDDYSRYMIGLELYLSQTAENLIELYRRSIAEYGIPKEMLTDNGRQYTNWRGKSRFEAELQKDKVHHIKSQPHHPMTLGKIERFWKTIYEEFLVRAQFESFENAQERVRLWTKYYNHRRPHQGIKGLCPADRYYEIHNELRKTIEDGIAENVLEMALRGKPKEPFYMVGRFEGQSVVLRAQKGKLKLLVDDKEGCTNKELEYDIMESDDNGKQRNDTEQTAEATTTEAAQPPHNDTVHGTAEVSGSAVDLVGEAQPFTNLSRAVNHMDYFESVAGTGAGGNAAGLGVQSSTGPGTGTEPPASGDAAQEADSLVPDTALDREAQGTPANITTLSGVLPITCTERVIDDRSQQRPCASEGGSYHEGEQRYDQRNRGFRTTSGIPQDLLRVGEAGAVWHAGITHGRGTGQAAERSGPAERSDGTADPGTGTGFSGCEAICRGETNTGPLPTAAEAAAKRFFTDR